MKPGLCSEHQSDVSKYSTRPFFNVVEGRVSEAVFPRVFVFTKECSLVVGLLEGYHMICYQIF